MAYVKFNNPISENNNINSMLTIVKYEENGNIQVLGSISDLNELYTLIDSDSLKTNYNTVDIFQILLDSFRYNNIRWVKDSEAMSNDFKFIQWPDTLIKTHVGICQGFFYICIFSL